MIILDYSQVCIAGVSSFLKDLESGSEVSNRGLIKHVILNSIVSFRKKWDVKEYGEIIIACDSGNYWRKKIFPPYKAGRKKAREASSIDWGFIFEVINETREDLDKYFPYRVVYVEEAEADDIMAVLAEMTQTAAMVKVGMMYEPQRVLGISEDLDFVQLYQFPNFQLFMPRKKKLYKKPTIQELKEFRITHVVKAGDDGIPNILSADDVFIQEPKGRQTTVSSKRLTEFKELGRDACRNDSERRGWDRNEVLIDFKHIPEHIKESIIEAYNNASTESNKNDIFNYLIQNRLRNLLDKMESF